MGSHLDGHRISFIFVKY